MRSREEVALVLELVSAGRNDCEIARETGIPRGTVRGWRKGQTPDFDRIRSFGQLLGPPCLVGGDPLNLPQAPYTYLLGLYLGDGCLTSCPREVYRLRIVCTNRYPQLIRECELAMAEVLSNKVSRVSPSQVKAVPKWPRTRSTGCACSRSMDPARSTSGRSS
jgi:hypothetical protein